MRTLHLPLDLLYRFFLTWAEAQHLFVALAASGPTAAAVGVAVGPGAETVVLTAFFYGCTQADNAQARRTGTFCLGCSSHFAFSW